ncbi:MAG: hypothetical protein IJS90_00815 [Clostridia bacterium]|nr:hypothetical protein [Clostridia bacterium]
MKKALSLALSLIMVFSILAVIPVAANADAVISSVDLVLVNEDLKYLNGSNTEGAVDWRFCRDFSVSTAGCGYDKGNSGLSYKKGSGFWGIGNGSATVSSGREYYFCYYVTLEEGYDWISSVKNSSDYVEIGEVSGFKVSVNGENRTDVVLKYNDPTNKVWIYVPLGEVSEPNPNALLDENSNDISANSGSDNFFIRFINSIRDFFQRIADFFANLFN